MILRGNLAPDGAVIKQTAASPQLLQHRGPAYVFENYEQMHDADRSRRSARYARTVLVMKTADRRARPASPNGARFRCRACCWSRASTIWCGSAMRA